MAASESPDLSGSRWWRASEYEVVGGTHIAPTEDADVEIYDPFAGHDAFWGGRSRQETPPYEALANLDVQDEAEILDFCRRYGLLGVLPQRTLEAFFWPYWDWDQQWAGGGQGMSGTLDDRTVSRLFPVQRQYRRGEDPIDVQADLYPTDGGSSGAPLSESEMEKAREERLLTLESPIRTPGARIVRHVSGSATQAGLPEAWVQFFPRRPGVVDWVLWHWEGTYWEDQAGRSILDREAGRALAESLARRRYPVPYSPEFLSSYGEPLRLFVQRAQLMAEFYRQWQRAAEVSSVAELDNVFRADERLPAGFRPILRSLHPYGRPRDRAEGGVEWQYQWDIPSLFAGLTVMLFQDFAFRDAIGKTCDWCGELFTTDNPAQDYCTSRCRETAAQARRREKRREEGKRPS